MAYEYVTKLATLPGTILDSHPSTLTAGSIDIYLYKDPATKKLYVKFSDPRGYWYSLTYINWTLTVGTTLIQSGTDVENPGGWYLYDKYFEVQLPLGTEVVICQTNSYYTDNIPSGSPYFGGRAYDSTQKQYTYKYVSADEQPIHTGFIPTENNLWNAPPTISGSDTNMGQKTDPFTYAYTLNDTNSTDNLTITEKANGVTIRTITNAIRGQTYTADLSSVWKQMPVNTSTTLTITVSDGKVTTTRTITFTRKEDRVVAYFKQASLTPESVQPEQVLIRVIRTIATNADFKVFVCNNGLDDSPTWEDATSAVLAGEAYTFTNRMKTAENYAVNVKIQVLKNTASAYSYIKALGFSYI